MATSGSENRSIPELLGDLSGNVSTLMRKEIQLARAETSEKVSQAMVSVGSILGGAVLALAALIVLLQALVIALTNAGIPAGWSALIVGVIVAGIGYALIHKGTNDLKADNLAPERTIDSLKQDAQTLKEQTR
jgi:VIT1/CCC1 family predicted Fe2+/Mn2+ transporter